MRKRPFILRILLCLTFSFLPLSEVNNRLYDFRMSFGQPAAPPTNVVLIDIEGREFQLLRERLGQKISFGSTSPVRMEQLSDVRDLFYWDPQIYSRFLDVAQSYKPTAIVFTLYFPKGAISQAETSKKVDWLSVLLLRARSARVLWSSQFDVEGNFLRPADELAAISNYGFNNIWQDRDGVIRRLPLISDNHASLALATNYVLGEDLSAFSAPEAQHLINYIGPAGSFKVCHFSDFIDGAQSVSDHCGDLSGKVLIVGKDILRQGVGSGFRTPMGEMSRTEIIANAILTLQTHRFISELDFWPHFLLRIIFVLSIAAFILFFPMLQASLLSGLFAALVLGPVYQCSLMLFGIHIPEANDIASCLATYLVFTGFKVAYQENLQWKALKQAQILREVDRIKTNFLSLFSHDLKTPIAKIQGVAELLLREGDLKPIQVEHLKAVLKSNNELKDYIISILNLSRIETDKIQLNKKSNDINQLIVEVVDRFAFLADQKEIKVSQSLEPMFSIEYDEDLIRQVINNLVDNAIKYCPNGSSVTIRSYENKNAVWVEIANNGPVIKTDDLDKVFRKFSRLGDPNIEKVKGTGLGLYLSKYFIELHGGTIQVKSPYDSQTGSGTAFTFSLPIS